MVILRAKVQEINLSCIFLRAIYCLGLRAGVLRCIVAKQSKAQLK